jgi:hypothetical protein
MGAQAGEVLGTFNGRGCVATSTCPSPEATWQ